MAKNPNRKPAKRNDPMGAATTVFLAGCFAELYLLMIRRFYINGSLEQVLAWHSALPYLIGAGVVVLAAGIILALKWKKNKKLRPYGVWSAAIGAFLAVSTALVWWNMSSLTLLTAVVPVVMLLAQLTMQNMGGYIYPDYYNHAGAQSVSTVLMMGSMLVSAALAGPLAARFGKAELAAAANLFAGLVSVATYVLRPESVWIFVGLQTLGWLGLGLFSMVSWALITDVIDDSEIQNGVREDGSIYAMYSFARKMGQAIAAGVSGWLLTAIGYVPGAAGGQTQEVLSGIFAIATLVPALGFVLLAAVLWWWYPLHKRQAEENAALLKARRAQEE